MFGMPTSHDVWHTLTVAMGEGRWRTACGRIIKVRLTTALLPTQGMKMNVCIFCKGRSTP